MKCEVSVFIRTTQDSVLTETNRKLVTIPYTSIIEHADHCDIFELFGTRDLLFLGKTNNFVMIVRDIERQKIETLIPYKFHVKA